MKNLPYPATPIIKILHDRASRGESLSETEKARLEAWYKAQDERENFLLNANAAQYSLEIRKALIEEAFSKLNEFSSQFKKISAENDILRRENEVLREKLAEKLSLKIV